MCVCVSLGSGTVHVRQMRLTHARHAIPAWQGESRVRISFPGGTAEVREAMQAFAQWWGSPSGLKFRGGQ